MRFTRRGARSTAASPPERIHLSMERNMKCGVGHCGHCQLGPTLDLPRRARLRLRRVGAAAGGERAVSACRRSRSWRSGSSPRATAASSRCSTARTSCSRSPARSRSPTSSRRRARSSTGPYDLSLVEGSVTTAHDAERIQRGARASRSALVTIGACATAGGIQALRNFADVDEFLVGRLRHAGVHLDARHLDADLGARARRLRAARLPDRQAPAARGDHAPSCTAAGPTSRRRASASSASGAATSA